MGCSSNSTEVLIMPFDSFFTFLLCFIWVVLVSVAFWNEMRSEAINRFLTFTFILSYVMALIIVWEKSKPFLKPFFDGSFLYTPF